MKEIITPLFWRYILTVFLCVGFSIGLFGQSKDDTAKYLYIKAEENYNTNKLFHALQLLKETETIFGKTNPKILYLKLKTYQKIVSDSCTKFPLSDTAVVSRDLRLYLDDFSSSIQSEEKIFDVIDIKKAYENFRANGCFPFDKSKTPHFGRNIPEITLTDVNNKTVKLKNYKGKFILLSFCKESGGAFASAFSTREACSNLKDAFNEFKGKNIVFINFYMGVDKNGWLKFIKENNFSQWENVSDLKVFKGVSGTTFGIQSYPTYLLISPEGIVVLDGEENGILSNLNFNLRKFL